jgi:hypothetical protein
MVFGGYETVYKLDEPPGMHEEVKGSLVAEHLRGT